MARVERAVRVTLSANTTVVISGRGRVLIEQGGARCTLLNDKEARGLAEEVLAFMEERAAATSETARSDAD